MTQDELKQAVARAARDYVADRLPVGAILGVGTGSTANFFIDEIASIKDRLGGAVASSEATAKRLTGHGIRVLDLNDVDQIGIYVDGADEIDHGMAMVKGGGGALTREKIVAAVAGTFVCICDASKRVQTMGKFPLPVEVIPMARAYVSRELAQAGRHAETARRHGHRQRQPDPGCAWPFDHRSGRPRGADQPDRRCRYQRPFRPARRRRAAAGDDGRRRNLHSLK